MQRFEGDKQRRTWAEIIVLQLAKQAAKGNVQAFAVLADRVEGRVVSKVEWAAHRVVRSQLRI